MTNTLRLSLLLGLTALAGCGWLGEKDAPPLAGKREPVLQAPAADALTDAALDASQMPVLPDAMPNSVWTQALGYPTHNPGHLVLTGGLSKKLWSESVGKGIDRANPVMAAPVIADGRAFAIDAVGKVSAFDLKNGKRAWSVSTRGEKQSKDDLSAGGGIAYGRNMIIVANGSRDVVALNAQSGAELWRVTLSSPLRGAPALVAGRAYVTDVMNRVIALDAANGNKVWTFDGTPTDLALLGTPAPAIDTQRAVAALSNGVVVSLNLEDGQTQWDARFSSSESSAASLTDLRDVAGVPIIDNGRVYAASAAGRIVALDAQSGARIWQKDGRVTGSLWAANGVLFTQTREGVAARNASTGDLMWEAPLPQFEDAEDKEDPINWFGPYLLSGKLYSFGSAGVAVMFDPSTGKQLGTVKIDDNLAASPAIAGDIAAFITKSGTLSAWQ